MESVPLDSLGPVEPGNAYGFDVTAAVTGGGSYSFAISPGSTNGADYTSKEGSNPPTLEVKYEPVSSSTSTVPQVTSVSPTRGPTEGGTPVTIVGAAFAEGDTVTFDGVTASEIAVANAETITAIAPAHSAGPVDIAVTSVDGLKGTLTGGFTYSEPPSADSGGPYGGAEGAPVSFDASGSYDPDGDPLTYSWDFGDGSVGGGISPNHTYGTGGTYNVTVVVNDGVSSTWTSTTATIIEVNEPPVASVGGPYRGAPGVELTFDGSGSFDPDGDALTYSWYFGDGSAGIGVSPSHTYAKSGDYVVELVVNDGTVDSNVESSEVLIVATATAVEMRVSSSKDDAEESSSGKVSYTSSDLEFLRDGRSGQTLVGMRWANVPVPRGAIVTRAHIELTTDERGSRATDLVFYAEASDNAVRFANASFDISSRAQTTASVTWNDVPAWTLSEKLTRRPTCPLSYRTSWTDQGGLRATPLWSS